MWVCIKVKLNFWQFFITDFFFIKNCVLIISLTLNYGKNIFPAGITLSDCRNLIDLNRVI